MAKRIKTRGKLAEAVLEDVDSAIGSIRGKLSSNDLKGSLSDLVHLLQLRRELTDMQPRQVTVRWIDECQTKPANEE
jgi:hypothetical protein